MEINIQNQLIIIAYSLLLGLIFGAEYDIIRIAHIMLGGFRLKQPIVFLLDLAYMLTLTVGISVFAYAFNHGIWRLYILIPVSLGFVLYYNTVGRIVMLFSETLIGWIRTVLRYAVILPIGWLLRCIGTGGKWVFRHTLCALMKKFVAFKRKRYTDRQKRMLHNMIRI